MVHKNIQKARGRASDYTCQCGKPAKEWAYQVTPEALVAPSGALYSENPEDYTAMCKPCHTRLDIAVTPDRYAYLFSEKTSIRKRRRCLECGRVSTLGPIASHQKGTGHVGLEDTDDPVSTLEKPPRLRRRRCLECGFEAKIGQLEPHLKLSGHNGYENIE